MNKLVQKYIQRKNATLYILIGLMLLMSAVAFANKTNPLHKCLNSHKWDPAAWINSEPLSVEDLRGKVVLIDVWTYGCWNCYKSFPWLRALEEKFSDQDFQVIGIHTPEFDREKERDNVVKKVEDFMLHHPVMMDNDFAYWRSYVIDIGQPIISLIKKARFEVPFSVRPTKATAMPRILKSSSPNCLSKLLYYLYNRNRCGIHNS